MINEDDICILPTINRAAAVVIPTQEMLNWINSTPAKLDDSFTLDQLQKENTNVFLLAEFPTSDDLAQWFKKDCKDAFAELLLGWCTDTSYWPELNWKTFEKFFEVRFESLVFDMGEGPIQIDDQDDQD